MTNRRLKRTGWLVVLPLLVFSLAAAKEKYEERFDKTVALAKDGKVDISNISGDITVMSWNQDQVKIEALKVSQASSLEKAKENAAKVTIEVVPEGNLLRIETKYPKSGKFWGSESVNVSVDYKLWIPEKAALKANNISGDITAEAIGGAAALKAVSGDIQLTKAAGGADCSSVRGNVTVADVTGSRFLKSVSGDVKGNLIKGSVEAETFSGGIETDFEIKVMGKLSPHSMSGSVNGGGAVLKVSSFSGDIKL